MAKQIQKPKLIVAEGLHEETFFGAFIAHLGLADIQVMGIGGKDKLKSELQTLVISPDFQNVASLGIVRDADDDPKAAFKKVCGALKAAGLPVPYRNLTAVGNKPKVIVTILPKGSSKGMLEDVCLNAVRCDPAVQCVNQYFSCLRNKALPLPRGLSLSKARIQAFLASRPETVWHVGLGAQKGYWRWDSEAFDGLRRFIRLL